MTEVVGTARIIKRKKKIMTVVRIQNNMQSCNSNSHNSLSTLHHFLCLSIPMITSIIIVLFFKLWELLLQLCMLFWILPTVIIFFFHFIILAVPTAITTSVMISIPIFIFTYNSISSSILIFNSIFISISTSILTHTAIPFLPHVHIIEIR